MRKTSASSLPDICTVKRPAKTKTTNGGTIETYTEIYTNIPVNSSPRVLREIKEDFSGGKVQSGVRWVCRFEFGIQIELDDRLVITEAGTGVTYELEVTSHLSPESYGTGAGVQCIRVV